MRSLAGFQEAAKYVGIFASVVVLFGLSGIWHSVDWWVYEQIYRAPAPEWDDRITLVDVPYLAENGSFDLAEFRTRLGAVLQQLAKTGPKAVVLDVWFDADKAGIQAIEKGLIALERSGIKIYGAVNPWYENSPALDPNYLQRHQNSFYEKYIARGHTVFSIYSNTAFYRPYLEFPPDKDGLVERLSALPVSLAQDLFGRPFGAPNEELVVMLGNKDDLRRHTVRWLTKSGELDMKTIGGERELAGRIAVVGSLERDISPYRERSGPELLAWALMARVKGVDQQDLRIANNPWLLVALLVVLSALAAGTFTLLYRRVRFFNRKPSLAVLVAFSLVCILLAMLVWGIYGLGVIYAQITLVLFGIGIAVLLARRRARELDLCNALENDLRNGVLGAIESYDVFISYSHDPENMRWVEDRLYRPLLAVRKADGSPLRVFFDKDSIKTGMAWYQKLAHAIEGSHWFVAIYSNDYLKKPYCLRELHWAAIKEGRLPGFILPLSRGGWTESEWPLEVRHIQYLDVTAAPELISDVIERLSN